MQHPIVCSLFTTFSKFYLVQFCFLAKHFYRSGCFLENFEFQIFSLKLCYGCFRRFRWPRAAQPSVGWAAYWLGGRPPSILYEEKKNR